MFDEVIKVVKELTAAINQNTERLGQIEIALTDVSGNIVDLSKDILSLLEKLGNINGLGDKHESA